MSDLLGNPFDLIEDCVSEIITRCITPGNPPPLNLLMVNWSIHVLAWHCITKLNFHVEITDRVLSRTPMLRELVTNFRVSGAGLPLSLTSLDVVWHNKIRDVGLKRLANLRKLILQDNQYITNLGLSHCSGLTYLDIASNCNITDDGLRGCRQLTTLILSQNDSITDKGLLSCPALTMLDLCDNNLITDQALSQLTSLKTLDLTSNTSITCAGVSTLSNLQCLMASEVNRLVEIGHELDSLKYLYVKTGSGFVDLFTGTTLV